MIAANILRGDMPVVHWDTLGDSFLLDVRNPPEVEADPVPGAVNIPLPQLRSRLAELPKDKQIASFCRSAQRSYYATTHIAAERF